MYKIHDWPKPGNDSFFYGCGCGINAYDTVRRDCHWYHCEHQMGASIDCCTLKNGLGECPCSEDCKDYISNKEINGVIKNYIKHRNQTEDAPATYGHWMVTTESFTPELICSVCNVRFPAIAGCCIETKLKYCPNCGTQMKMDGDTSV